jgi:hypothetical protein
MNAMRISAFDAALLLCATLVAQMGGRSLSCAMLGLILLFSYAAAMEFPSICRLAPPFLAEV